jgi:hypothetical protein
MIQQEIKFFFPLTEQIPLDLDYSPCSAHEYYIRAKGIAGTHGPFPTGMVFVSDTPGTVTINTSVLTIKGTPMTWYRKILFKLLGFKYD